MKNISQILKKTREKNKITLEEASSKTKIRIEYLEALEKGEFEKIPTISASKGFIKIYSKFLGINSEDAITLFRRDNKLEENHMLKKKKKKLRINSLIYRKLNLYLFFLLIVIFLLIVYGIHEYFIFITPPKLDILYPKSNILSVNKSQIEFKGSINPANLLYIDGEKIQNVSLNGNFSTQIGLQEGLNNIQIDVKSILGETNYKNYYITYINKKKLAQEKNNTFYIEIKSKNNPVFINAIVQNKTIYNKILKGNVTLKGVYNIVLTTSKLQNISLYYNNKNIALQGSGFTVIVIKYNKGKIDITKN